MPFCCGSRPGTTSEKYRREQDAKDLARARLPPAKPRPAATGRNRSGGETSGSDDEGYFSAEEDFGVFDSSRHLIAASLAKSGAANYGIGVAGQCAVGGKWVTGGGVIDRAYSEFSPTDDVGWDQPSPKEVDALTEVEAQALDRLADAVGREDFMTLPADLQMAFLRDIFFNEGCDGWTAEEQFPNTVELLSSCVRWRKSIQAETIIHGDPPLENEAMFRDLAKHSFSGTDKWGHPRIWAPVTGWPPVEPMIKKMFTPEEVCQHHCKRFLTFNQRKREISEEKQRPVMMHCVVLAFTPETNVSIAAGRWFNDAMQWEGRTIEQWFFPMSLRTPALIVNMPWHYRTLANLAKKFMLKETADKFVIADSDFLPLLREQGVPYEDVPDWVKKLAKNHDKITW